ncbi:MAG: TetR/AcrR family transcriptional regulator [Flavobacterium sp.]
MATKKVPAQLTKDDMTDKYADYCLMHGHQPASVYKFSKENGFEEAEFYKHFASFEALERGYLTDMFRHTVETLDQSPTYTAFSGVEKLSAFYFTFFELATANRSFVVYMMDEGAFKNLQKLATLRKDFTAFAEAVLEKPVKVQSQRADKLQGSALKEAAWMQFLTIFRFWVKDTSPGFEKTDVFIEKSVKASADLVYNSPLNSLVDLGKFIWKEKFTV